MLILVGHATTPDKLKLITSAAGDIDVYVSYIDCSDASPPVPDAPNKQATNITTATTTDILAGVANAAKRRNVKEVTIRNAHATVSNDITVVVDAIDGSDYELHKATLASGEMLQYAEGVGWFEVGATAAVGVFNASVAAQGPGFSSDTYVTGSNLLIGGRAKVGTIMRWDIHMSKTGASTAVTATIIRFGTAGAIGDTARVTMAGPAQTGVVDEGILHIEAVFRAVGSGTSGIVQGGQGLQHSAAVAAGFGEMFDAITSGGFDTTVAGLQAGISLNGSTAAAWTITQVQAEAFNLL